MSETVKEEHTEGIIGHIRSEVKDSSFVGTELQEQAIRDLMDKVFAAPKITQEESDRNTRDLEVIISALEIAYPEDVLQRFVLQVKWGGQWMHCKIDTLRALRKAREEFRNDVQ